MYIVLSTRGAVGLVERQARGTMLRPLIGQRHAAFIGTRRNPTDV